MIFKTFDNKIDKWTAKIGIFGKSFNELGTSVNNAFKSVIDNINNFDENVGFWESLKNNIFSTKDSNKDWLKNSLGQIVSKENIDSYIKELDLDSAKKKLEEIFDWQEDINNGETTWNKYFDTCKGGNEYLIDVIKNTDDLSKLTGEDLVKANQQARASALAHNEAIKAQTFSAKAGKVALQALAMAGNMIAMWGISQIISGLHELSQVSNTVAEKARDLGSSFNSSASDIDTYKSKIEDLYKTINDSNSSISAVTEARKNLMTIQDELIEKYGAEKETIDIITDAINGQADAFDRFAEKQWQETKNQFNDTGFWEGTGNWLDGFDSNIDRMVARMEHAREILSFSANNLDSGNFDDLVHQMEKLGWTYQSTLGGFVKEGNLKGIYSEILDIQNLVKDMDAPEGFLKDLTKDANSTKEILEDYGEMWDTYILRDVILENEELTESWNAVNEAYSEYKKAFESGDNDAQSNAIGGFSQSLNNVLDNSNVAESVKEYFRGMYPTLTNEVEKWEFRFKILPGLDTHALKGKIQADILEMLQADGSQYGEDTFNSLLRMASDYGIVIGEDSEKINQLLDLLVEWEVLQGEVQETIFNEPPKSFNTEDYKDQLDNIQSSISTLRSALESLNKGELDKLSVIDLMQEFPSLAPYIDLTAEGFGNLSEGLSKLIEQQPDSLIQSLNELKDSLTTDEERQQVELLIDSLQRLSSYGDSGIEAYTTTISNTWNDTANVIEGVTTQFENLAKVQEMVADGLTMTATQAAELAKIYPEILTNAELSSNGQITLNEDVVRSILDGDQSIIDAQITKLEADKAELTAKKDFAEAQLEIVKQVGEGEGKLLPSPTVM